MAELAPHGRRQRLVAGQGVDRVAGHGVDEGEDQERGPEEDGHDLQQPAGNKAAQPTTCTSWTRMRLNGSMATWVTRSPWTARVFPNHSGMTGMSSRITSSAAW